MKQINRQTMQDLISELTAANKRVEILEQEVANQNKADFAIASSIRERAAKICEDEALGENEDLTGIDATHYALGCTACCNAILQMEIP